MSTRDQILAKIKANLPAPTSLPTSHRFESNYSDLLEQFSSTLAAIGGRAVQVKNYEAIIDELNQHFGEVANKASTIPELSPWTDFSLNVEDPHLLENIQVAVISGHFGVAENGAVWVTDDQLSHRVLPFITQYLAIVIKKNELVANMHDATKRIGSVEENGWAAFIAGPSKTADIEQSLVIGAHGPRGMTVYLID